jgi:hypothetical protein
MEKNKKKKNKGKGVRRSVGGKIFLLKVYKGVG